MRNPKINLTVHVWLQHYHINFRDNALTERGKRLHTDRQTLQTLGVSQYIEISQYMKNLYHIAIGNWYRNILRFFFLLIKLFIQKVLIQFLYCSSFKSKSVYLSQLYPYKRSSYNHVCMYIILIYVRFKIKTNTEKLLGYY